MNTQLHRQQETLATVRKSLPMDFSEISTEEMLIAIEDVLFVLNGRKGYDNKATLLVYFELKKEEEGGDKATAP